MPNKKPQEITFEDYCKEIKEITDIIIERNKKTDRPLHEIMYETVDSHQWIIYNGYPLMILMYSDNDNAYFHQFDNQLGQYDNANKVNQVLALYAFEADIRDEIDSR